MERRAQGAVVLFRYSQRAGLLDAELICLLAGLIKEQLPMGKGWEVVRAAH